MIGQSQSSNAITSLVSPVKLNVSNSNGVKSYSGGGLHLMIAGGGSLPANFSPPVVIIGSSQPSNPNSLNGTATSLKIVNGESISGTADDNQALVGKSMAQKNDLHVGSTFTAYGKTLTVAGIFESGTEGGDNHVIVSLPTEQKLSGQGSDITDAVATVDSLDNLNSATTAIKNKLGSSADITSSEQQAEQALQPLRSVEDVSVYSLVGAIIAGSVIILLTMIMIVRERRREIGILKAIGGSNMRIILQFVCEALTLTVLGSVIGLTLGVVGGSPVTSTLVSNGNGSNSPSLPPSGGGFHVSNPGLSITGLQDVHAQIGWSILAYGLGAALLIAIAGSAFAGWLIARVRPSEVMRTE